MIFLYAIFCQWLSRGCLLKCCLEQEKWEMLVIAFLIGFAIGSPVQGYMSDKSSRKKLLITTILCVILSLLVIVFGHSFCPKEYFPIFLAIACIINGIFGNVFPVAAAAYSEQIGNFQGSLRLSVLCRYGALILPFLLKLPALYDFITALAINQTALLLIALKFKEKSHIQD